MYLNVSLYYLLETFILFEYRFLFSDIFIHNSKAGKYKSVLVPPSNNNKNPTSFCIHVHVYICVQVPLYVFMNMDTRGLHQVFSSMSFTLLFQIKSLTEPRALHFSQSSRPVNLRSLPFSPPQSWDYRHIPPYPVFIHGYQRTELISSCFHRKHLSDRTIFPAPQTTSFKIQIK